MTTTTFGIQKVLSRSIQILALSAAVLIGTLLIKSFGAAAYASTAAFIFIILVILSAFFFDTVVAVSVSFVAAFCFDFFFLPPYGTLNIAAFPDWISLISFLLASVIISYLTTSAVNSRRESAALSKSLRLVARFSEWLVSQPEGQLTLSGIARKALEEFSLSYCALHVYAGGKWRNYSGTAQFRVSRETEARLKWMEDHPTKVMELAKEDETGVRYRQMHTDSGLFALLAVKSDTLPDEALRLLAAVIAVKLTAADQTV